MKKLSAGSSYAFTAGLKSGRLITDHACALVVRDPEGAVVISRSVTDRLADDSAFVVLLTPAETASFSEGDYKVCTRIALAAENFSKENDFTLPVKASCFP